METLSNGETKTRDRSPNYPSLTLEKSLDLAKILFSTHGRHAVPLEVVAKDWNVSPKSSYISQHIAALSAYGLIDVEGSKEERKLTISDMAFNIFIDRRPDSQERDALIREAAVKPYMFKRICDDYPDGLPAEHLLDYELVKTHRFNQNAVKDFINVFRKTMDYAKVYECDKIEADIKRTEDTQMIPASQKTTLTGGAVIGGAASIIAKVGGVGGQPSTPIMEIPIPISLTEVVTIRVPYPLSEQGWNQMLSILKAYKPSLVPSSASLIKEDEEDRDDR